MESYRLMEWARFTDNQILYLTDYFSEYSNLVCFEVVTLKASASSRQNIEVLSKK